jgi:hypothetical protein
MISSDGFFRISSVEPGMFRWIRKQMLIIFYGLFFTVVIDIDRYLPTYTPLCYQRQLLRFPNRVMQAMSQRPMTWHAPRMRSGILRR